jgi:hypothetical protein
MHSRYMEGKIVAIDKYLVSHFDTDQKVFGFMREMADTLFLKLPTVNQ